MSTLYYGDNIEILRDEKRIPSESVDLCYIDPPFNSQQNYNQIYSTVKRPDAAQEQAFTDMWTWDKAAALGYQEIINNQGGRFQGNTIELIRGMRLILGESPMLAYLISITLRVVEIHRSLKPSGSFYLHCDPTASHYLKLLLDASFGPKNFRSEIIWRRSNGHNKLTRQYGPIHDTILFYGKTNKAYFRPGTRPLMRGYVREWFTEEDQHGPYRTNMLTGPGTRNGDSGKPWGGFDPNTVGRHWAIPLTLSKLLPEEADAWTTQQKLDHLNKLGAIYIPREGRGQPKYKQYVSHGTPYQDIWACQPYTEGTLYGTDECVDADVKWIGHEAEKMGYQTQKPEGLLARIINSSSKKGDVVMDAYCGCGTTVAVAEKLQREWIGIDITYRSIALIFQRLEDTFGKSVMSSIRTDGIPRDMASAEALATRKDDRTRKEFEKWAVLTYTNNRAVIHEKKGADKGIDGVAYFATGKNEMDKMVFQVKSGDVKRNDISTLNSDRNREGAALATLITLREPTRQMREEAAHTEIYRHELTGRTMNRVQIVTIREMLEDGRRLDLPLTTEVLKQAPKHREKTQLGLLD